MIGKRTNEIAVIARGTAERGGEIGEKARKWEVFCFKCSVFSAGNSKFQIAEPEPTEDDIDREHDTDSGRISEPPHPPSRGRYGGTGVGSYGRRLEISEGSPPRYLGSYGTKGNQKLNYHEQDAVGFDLEQAGAVNAAKEAWRQGLSAGSKMPLQGARGNAL